MRHAPLRYFVRYFALIFVLQPIEAEAQQRTMQMFKIGWLSATAPGTYPGQKEIIRILTDFGHIEGKNISYEFRYAENKLDRLPTLAAELVVRNVDVLVTPGRELWPCGTRRQPSRSFFSMSPIQSAPDSSKAWHTRARTLLDSAASSPCSRENVWSYSKKRFQSCHESQCSGTRRI